MRFVDEARIFVKAGKGGRGCVSFRREKYIPQGGPDGGDGGEGGSVYLRADPRLLSLYDFRLKRNYEAQNGEPGKGGQCNGKKGANLVLGLPVGTLVFSEENGEQKLLADLSEPESLVLVAQGGRGGKGNEHFKSATMRAPRFSQPGEPGEEKNLTLELKILADSGLIGLPNAGKSTLISKLSAARPKIANYPFTTLTPNLGVMINETDPEKRLIIADIPGLIEGAHANQGLGHKFLKHVERTRFLVHVLSAEDINDDDPWAGFDLVNEELRKYDPELAERNQIQVVNKIDLLEPERLRKLKERSIRDNKNIYFISAQEGTNLEELKDELWNLNDTLTRHQPLARLANEYIPEEDTDFPEIEVEYTRD